MATGWQCPNCGKAHAPSVTTCPEAPAGDDLRKLYADPNEPRRASCGCPPGAFCNNVACPRITPVTCGIIPVHPGVFL